MLYAYPVSRVTGLCETRLVAVSNPPKTSPLPTLLRAEDLAGTAAAKHYFEETPFDATSPSVPRSTSPSIASMITSHEQLRRSSVLLLRPLFLSWACLAFIICPQKVLNCPQMWSLAVTIVMIFLTVRFSPAIFSSMVRCAASLRHLNRACSASSGLASQSQHLSSSSLLILTLYRLKIINY